MCKRGGSNETTMSCWEITSLRCGSFIASKAMATPRSLLPIFDCAYSEFKVGAAVLLENGEIVSGSNQENASLPAGICAERVTLSAASSLHPNVAIVALAISAKASDSTLMEPVAPCGICRQTILEYE